MSEGYSYTVIRAHPGEPVKVAVSFYLDQRARIDVYPGHGRSAPHLGVQLADASVSIGPAHPGQVTAEDAQLARRLADQTAKYAAEVEWLAAGGGPGGAAA
jgi:hypothetical protein